MTEGGWLTTTRVTEASGRSVECEAALRLADANRASLGFFPADAFREKADSGQLLVANRDEGEVVGYLLYRTARQRASITHLCVAEGARGFGVARLLVSALRERVADLRYIEAKCRKDFEAHRAWLRLGFAAEAEVRGRGRERKPITVFRYDLGHSDLFTVAPEQVDVVRCALDTSVMIGMQETTEDCRALLADWLTEEVEFVVTSELRNDLMESDDVQVRKRRLSYAATFGEVKSSPEHFEAALRVAREILPPSSAADARHLARASAAHLRIFLTTDEPVLNRAVQILDELDLRVLHPKELVRELDSIQKAEEYAPIRLAGTPVELCPLTPSELPRVEEALRYGGEGERRNQFKRVIRDGFSNDGKADVLWVRDTPGGRPIALLVGREANRLTYEVVALRVPPGRLSETGIMRVVARHMAFLAVTLARERGCSLIVVRDQFLHSAILTGLMSEGFTTCGKSLVRIQLEGIKDSAEVIAEIRRIGECEAVFVGACGDEWRKLLDELRDDGFGVALAESRFWPLRIRDAGVRSYIVPIQPQWAEHLFDPELASQGLFGADRRLGLAREGVYYRGTRGVRLRAPARILWYVSASPRYEGAKAIRVCSTLNRVETDTAQNLYRRYRRLGVWHWRHVLHKAKGDANRSLMALEFGQSECFRRPVHYDEAVRIIGKSMTFQGPVELSEEAFMEIYELGMRKAS